MNKKKSPSTRKKEPGEKNINVCLSRKRKRNPWGLTSVNDPKMNNRISEKNSYYECEDSTNIPIKLVACF